MVFVDTENIIDSLNEKYQDMYNGEKTRVEIATMYYSGEDGLFVVGDNVAFGFKSGDENTKSMHMDIYDISEEDGKTFVTLRNCYGVGIEDYTKKKLISVLEQSNRQIKKSSWSDPENQDTMYS